MARPPEKDEDMMPRYIHLNAVWKKKRTILLCLMAILTAVLIYWHRQITGSVHSTIRGAGVRKIMNAHGHKSGRRYQVRGPLTIAQVERELFGMPLDSNGGAGTPDSADLKKAWEGIRNNYRDGDELYFFRSDKRSWARLSGSQGYVLIRQSTVVDVLTTLLN